MKLYRYPFAVILLFGLYASPGHTAGDPVAGKSRATVCLGCHGADGNSSIPLHPSLAGQPPAYLEAQLHHFKSGMRVNPGMKAIADELSDADIQNLAAYFSSLPVKPAGGDAHLAKAGQAKIPMCMGCHGDTMGGRGQIPRLAGQQPQYMAKQMHDFKSGARKSGPMGAFAQSLTDEEVQALSAYLGTLSP